MDASTVARSPRASGWRLASALILAAVAVLALFGCRDELTSDIDTNRSPDTYLTGFPPESTTTIYRVHLFWYGNDADGMIANYEYAITDSFVADEDTLTYRETTRTDSVFLFPVSAGSQVLGHRFYIRAIDNEGTIDPEPAWCFFGAADPTPPQAEITLAQAFTGSPANPVIIRELVSEDTRIPSDTIPAGSNVRFRWGGYDTDQVVNEDGQLVTVGRVVGYEHFLFPGQAALTGGPEDTAAVYTELTDGKYEFRLKAIDDAGYAGLDPALRTFVWNYDPNTRLETGLTPAGATRPHVLVTSDGWQGAREFFYGDTIPLRSKNAFAMYNDTLKVRFSAYDPDDNLGAGVSNFQWREKLVPWKTVADTINKSIVFVQNRTADLAIEVRCQDGYGRWDGTPARMPLYIDKAPRFEDTLAVVGGVPLMQYPMPNEQIPMDSLRAWNWVLPVRVRATDPDTTTNRFSYQFRLGGTLYDNDPLQPGADAIAYYALPIASQYRTADKHRFGIRVTEVSIRDVTRRRDWDFDVYFVE